MADIYTKPSLSGYNSNPPADDGTQVASNEITWSKHKTKLGDPLKTYIDAINNETDAAFDRLVAPPNATDSGTDAYTGNSGRTLASGEVYVWDFQSANTTTTPTLNDNGQGAKTIKTRDGSALWAGAIDGPHRLEYDGTDYLLLDPVAVHSFTANSIVKRGSDGRVRATKIDTGLGSMEVGIDEDNMASDSDTAVPTQQSVKAYALTGPGTSSDPSLAFDAWRTPNANRPTFVMVDTNTQTNGTTSGQVWFEVDESGGTTPDYKFVAIANANAGSGHSIRGVFFVLVPSGGAYRIKNQADPNSTNSISDHREQTL